MLFGTIGQYALLFWSLESFAKTHSIVICSDDFHCGDWLLYVVSDNSLCRVFIDTSRSLHSFARAHSLNIMYRWLPHEQGMAVESLTGKFVILMPYKKQRKTNNLAFHIKPGTCRFPVNFRPDWVYAWICSVCDIVLLSLWDCIVLHRSLCVRVCGSDLHPRREAHSGNVTRRCYTRRRSRTSEATGLGYRHAYLEFVREALIFECFDASSNAVFQESIIGIKWYILWHVLERNKVLRRIGPWHPQISCSSNGCI